MTDAASRPKPNAVRAWLGGSFDPVHFSHIQLICHIYQSLQAQLSCDTDNYPAHHHPNHQPKETAEKGIVERGMIEKATTDLRVNFLPTAGNPLKQNQSDGTHRLAMLQLAIQEIKIQEIEPQAVGANAMGEQVNHPAHARICGEMSGNISDKISGKIGIDTHEIHKMPPVFTIDTVSALREQYPEDCLIFVMGLDSFLDLPKWKKGLEILQKVHLWVVVRQEMDGKPAIPTAQWQSYLQGVFGEDWAKLAPRLTDVAGLIHHTHGGIYLDNVNIIARSSSQIRRLIAQAVDTPDALSSYLPSAVQAYIKEHGLYRAKDE